MQTLEDLLKQHQTPQKKQRGGVKSEWNEAVDLAMKRFDNMDMRTKKPWTYGRWARYLKGFSAQDIHIMMGSARDAMNPSATFNYLVKQRKTAKK